MLDAIIYTVVFANIISTLVCPLIASKKGRNVAPWILAGLFIGPIGIIIIALMPPLSEQERKKPDYYRNIHRPNPNPTPYYEERIAMYQTLCDKCGRVIPPEETRCPYCFPNGRGSDEGTN